MSTSQTRSGSVIETLRERLANGTWPVGTRLPGEHELAAELGMGRNTLREALRSLVNAGMLTARRGDGTYVTATDPFAAALQRRVSAEEASHLSQVRAALEIEAAGLAAQHATERERAEIVRLFEQRPLASVPGNDAAFLEADLAFHEAIVDAAHNPLLSELYRSLDRSASYAKAHGRTSLTPGTPAMDDAHGHLTQAICRGDRVAALAAARVLADESHALIDIPAQAPGTRPGATPAHPQEEAR